jgi:hypothetical protein
MVAALDWAARDWGRARRSAGTVIVPVIDPIRTRRWAD